MTNILIIIVRFVLASVFLIGGIVKLTDFLSFADSVAAFRILPANLIIPVALGLPVFEIILGLGFLFPNRIANRISSLAGALLLSLFIAAFIWTIINGWSVECRCFGDLAIYPKEWGVKGAIFRNVILLSACLRLWFKSIKR